MVAHRSALWLVPLTLGGVLLASAPLHAQTAPRATAPSAPPLVTTAPVALQAPAPITKKVLGLTFTFAAPPPINGYDALQAAGAQLQTLDARAAADVARNNEAAQREYVTNNAPVLAQVRQALQLPYQAPPPTPYDTDREAFKTNLEAKGRIRSLARLLQAEGALALQDGDMEGALNSALDTMLVSVVTARDGSILATLSAAAIEDNGRRQLWSLMPKLSNEQAQYVQEQLLRIDARRAPVQNMFYAEKYEMFVLLQAFLRETKWDEANAVERETALKNLDEGHHRLAAVVGLDQNEVAKHINAVWDAQMTTLRQPYTPPVRTEAPQQDTFLDVFTKDTAPYRVSYERNRANTRLLMVALALRVYERDKGQLPATLGDLSPNYLAQPVMDPFVPSQEFRYKPTGQSFTLYSVGSDGQDDDGLTSKGQDPRSDLVAPLHTFAP